MNYVNFIDYRKIRTEIKKIAFEYITTHDRHSDSRNNREDAYVAIMRVAFGATYEVNLKDVRTVQQTVLNIPVSWVDHLLMSLPCELQFGWFKPRFRKVTVNTVYEVFTTVTFPNKPMPLNYKDDTYTYVEYL